MYEWEADFIERRLFGTEHRGWACSKATGDTLEVAIGTGLNRPHYPPDVRVTGVDLSSDMLAIAVTRSQRCWGGKGEATSKGPQVNHRQGSLFSP